MTELEVFTRHRLRPTNELNCPHAMGTNAFSRIMIPRLPLRLRSGLRQKSGFRQRAQTPAREPQLSAATIAPFDSFAALSRSGQAQFVYYGRWPTNLRVRELPHSSQKTA